MNRNELSRGISAVAVGKRDKKILHDIYYDIERQLSDIDEVQFLNTMERVGRSCESSLSGIADLLAQMSTHEGAMVLVLDLGADTVEDVGPTPD